MKEFVPGNGKLFFLDLFLLPLTKAIYFYAFLMQSLYSSLLKLWILFVHHALCVTSIIIIIFIYHYFPCSD